MVEPLKSARTVVTTSENKQQDPNKKEGVEYKAIGKPDISYGKLRSLYANGDVYLDNGFFCLGDGSFYDADGFFFDKDGYDKYGGYYDEEANYIPGEDKAKEYYDNYEEFEEEDELDE